MARLIINPTSSSRREIALARTLVSIGRDPSNDLVLPDAMVSRRHAVIECRGAQYYIRDCNSSNGSLVNGDRVSERSLRDGDLVAIGTARLLFREDYEEDSSGKVVQHPSAPKLHCPTCQADYRKGDVFCRQCGGNLAPPQQSKTVCTACGTVVTMPARFCNACGTELQSEASALEVTKPRPLSELGVDPKGDAPKAAAPPPPPRVSADAPTVPPSQGAVPEPRNGPPRSSAAAAPASAPSPVPAPVPAPLREVARPVPVRDPDSDRSTAQLPRSPLAPVGPRVAAGLLDAAIVSAVQALLVGPAWLYWRPYLAAGSTQMPPFWAIVLTFSLVPIAAALAAVYYVYYWGVKGATPAKRLLGLAVETVDGQRPVGVARAGIRFLGYLLSGVVFGIGFLMILFGGQGLHDRISDTRVVRPVRS